MLAQKLATRGRDMSQNGCPKKKRFGKIEGGKWE